jgi:hypothetical protein
MTSPIRVPRSVVLGLTALLAALASATGCHRAGPANTVSGRVTLDGRAVAGQVTFVGSDGKSVASPIKADGSYTVLDPPRGENTVLVKSLTAAGASPAPPKGKAAMSPLAEVSGAPPRGVTPPARYAQPNNGLRFAVTGGRQSFDIELRP